MGHAVDLSVVYPFTFPLKILLEIASRLREPKIAEVPYTFRTRHLGESKLTSKVILNYLAQLIEMYPRLHPDKMRFLKYCAVGFSGVIINLLVFLAIVHELGWRDWRASALATFVAALSIFGWNEWRTFKDRSRAGPRSSAGYLCFAAAGLVVKVLLTSAAFELLFRAVTGIAPAVAGRTLALAMCQSISILLGTGTDYVLNRHITWGHERTTTSSL
jgi:dolichol-phosphate mannosyltransferase